MNVRVLIAIALPILVMLAWNLNEERLSTQGERVELKVTGYDPRDLLAGHYLIYRVDWGTKAKCGGGHSAACACLSVVGPGILAEAFWIGDCDERPQNCNVWVRGMCDWRGFEAGIERYYIPDVFSKKLRTVPDKSTIRLSVNAHGVARVTDFLVDGVPLLDYARKP